MIRRWEMRVDAPNALLVVVRVAQTALVANGYCLQLDFACLTTLATPSFRLSLLTIDLSVLIPHRPIWY